MADSKAKGKRVAIMGGTFNPIHLGHLLIAENAYETFNLDEVLFIPTSNVGDKKDVPDIWTRIEMTGCSIEDNNHFALSTIEADKKEISYSYETIAELKKRYPKNEYYFIVGADTFLKLGDFKCPEKIFSEVTILVANRHPYSTEEIQAKIKEYGDKYGAKVEILPIESNDLSSVKIRERVRAGKSIRYMVHYKAVEYIKKHGLYRINE